MRARPVPLVLILLVAAGWIAPRRSWAAPCCVSATAQGVGRLHMWEDWAIGTTSSVQLGIGAWDHDGIFRTYGPRYAETEARQELWGLLGLGRRANVWARVPGVLSWRTAGERSEHGGGLGDVQAGLRYEIVPFGRRPGVAASASILAPTGRPMYEATTALGTDATGRGAWVVGVGLSLEHTHVPWFEQLNLGATFPLPAERTDLGVDQRYGPGLQVGPLVGVELRPGLVLSASGRLSWEANLTLDGESVAQSSRIDVGIALAASIEVARHWTLQTSIDTGLFADHLGRNEPGRLTVVAGVRYGHFRD